MTYTIYDTKTGTVIPAQDGYCAWAQGTNVQP